MSNMEIDSDQSQQQQTPTAPAHKLVYPGDSLLVSGTGIRLGNGLIQASFVPTVSAIAATPATASTQPVGQVCVTKCGVLRRGPLGKLLVDNLQKRYTPAIDDMVIGVILEKHGESYRLDINASQPANLPALAFEGATKRNKPNLNVGALVYARVSIAHRDIEVELSCTSPHFKKDWVTGQSLYGELLGGYVISVNLRLARELLKEDCYVLQVLGKYIPFELAIGMNGKVWINSSNPLQTILISNAILNSEGKSKEHITSHVQKIMQAI